MLPPLFRCLVLLCLCTIAGRSLALTPEEREAAAKIQQTVRAAAMSYAAGQYAEAGQSIQRAMEQVNAALSDGSQELRQALEPNIRRIKKAHAMLEFEGINLPPFFQPEPGTSAVSSAASATDTAMTTEASGPTDDADEAKPDASPTPPMNSAVSFTEAVAPILANRCGRCHISESRGQFNLATYERLMQGPPEGVVVFPGDVVASRLIETIETGDMPRGGGRVPPAELETLKQWILAGAKFDGTDPTAPISSVSPSPSTNQPSPEVRQATGNETVSFAADVAPLLVENCNGCHLDAMQTRGGLRMDTITQLMRGGDSGAVVDPGNGESSLLIRKLRGMVGQRMPAGGRPALPEESIQLIAKWIDEGATFDGESENQNLRVMSQLAWAASATPEEMSAKRAELADEHLRLVTGANEASSKITTDHFLIAGMVPESQLQEIGRIAEAQMKTARTVVQSQNGEAFFHGRATIFVMPRRYDYSEFATMVEGRRIPSQWNSHWRFDGIDAYLSMVASGDEEEKTLEDRITAPLVSLAVATRGGSVPRWFAEGVGRATAARMGGSRDRDARRRAESEIAAAVAAAPKAKDFIDGKLPPEQADRIGTAIAATMMDRTRRRSFDALLRRLDEGAGFERAFLEVFGAEPTAFVDAWLKWASGS